MPNTKNKPRILLVDDDEKAAEGIALALETKGYSVKLAEDGDIALDLVEGNDYDAVLSDINMPVMDGLELMEKLREIRPRLPVILMTAYDSSGKAIEATKRGAFDYLAKPFSMPDLFSVLEKAVATNRLTAKRVIVPGEEGDESADQLIGSSPAMREMFKEIGRLAGKPVSVMIKGETGTGKELVARALYGHGARAGGPFIAVNCAAIPENLIESELFGHERGAFTGATERRIGRFEQADGGTLFLDEVGDLQSATQVKLLRVLQERQITRVGGTGAQAIDVLVISATHRDIGTMIEDGEFREDLYYRLAGAVIELPPLRERREDIPALAEHFFSQYAASFGHPEASLEEAAIEALRSGDWPGNVRELENVVAKALVDAQGLTVTEEHIAKGLRGTPSAKRSDHGESPPPSGSEIGGLIRTRLDEMMANDQGGALAVLNEEFEQLLYSAALDLTFGNQSQMAKLLGVSRHTVREKLDKFQLFPKRGKSD